MKDYGPYLSKSSCSDNWNNPSKIMNAVEKIPAAWNYHWNYSITSGGDLTLWYNSYYLLTFVNLQTHQLTQLTLHKTIENRHHGYLYFPGRNRRYRAAQKLSQVSELRHFNTRDTIILPITQQVKGILCQLWARLSPFSFPPIACQAATSFPYIHTTPPKIQPQFIMDWDHGLS